MKRPLFDAGWIAGINNRPEADFRFFGSRADINPRGVHVRLVPAADFDPYSITSSARASNVGGTERPSALAVLTLIASS